MYTRPTRLALACAGIFASIAASSSYAVTEEFNPVVVSGARFEQPLSEVLPSVTVITKDEIKRSQGRTIFEVLQGVPGLEIGATGGLGATASIFMRGENSNSIAIYVDGVRVQPDGYGSMSSNTSFPPLQSIERIEVLRGNAGALYGEGAIGGVVNIYTNAGSNKSPKAFATVTYGSHNTVDTTAGISGLLGSTKFNLSANDVTSTGFAPITPNQNMSPNPNTGSYKGHGFNLGASQIVNSDLEVGVKDRYQDNIFAYNKSGNAIDMRTIANDATVFAKLKVSEQWFSQLDLTNSKLEYGFNPLSLAGYSSGPASNTNSLNWSNIYDLGQAQKLAWGVNYSKQRYDDGSPHPRIARDSYGIYLGDTIKWGDFDFQLNGRYDAIKVNQPNASTSLLGATSDNQYFHATTGLFGVGYHLTNELRLTGTMSSGFRAPSVGEFFNDPFNPNLKPELHHTTEAGFEYKNSISLTRVVYFNTRTNNAISYDANFNVINIPTIKNHGFEVSEKATWNDYRLTVAYTHQKPVDESGAVLTRRAKDFGSVDLNKALGAYDLGSKVIFSGTRSDFDYNTYPNPYIPETLKAYQLWSFYAGYKYSNEITLRVRLDNAFNEKYQLAYGYNTPGRTAWLTLMYQQK